MIVVVEEISKDPPWPPAPNSRRTWPLKSWLRFDSHNPDHGRPSRLAAHPSVPFVKDLRVDEIKDERRIQAVAFRYLSDLNALLKREHRRGLDLPKGWLEALHPDKETPPNELGWLPIWPSLPSEDDAKDQTRAPNPTLASWNLSRNPGHALPAPVVLVAAETYTQDQPRLSHGLGLRVPMQIERTRAGFRVIIRSFTAELPRVGEVALTDYVQQLNPKQRQVFREEIQNYLDFVANSDVAQLTTATSAQIDPSSYLVEEFRFAGGKTGDGRPRFQFKAVGKARRSARLPRSESVHVTSSYTFEVSRDGQIIGIELGLEEAQTETESLITHAAPGAADVFNRPPPDWFDAGDPTAAYDYAMRRPTREDPVLERYRDEEFIGTPVPPDGRVALEAPGFRVRLCPDIVQADRDQPGDVKTVPLPGGPAPSPRRDDLSAINAFSNSRQFFDMLSAFGIDPSLFAVRAQTDVQIFYRSGIRPGGGGDGRTVNAQVTFDCKSSNSLPDINMRLALAELSRWDRDLTLPRDQRWAEPLSIGTSGRWMLHEFGHYMLAARIGQLEFKFAHSAGDAMAAVYFDPISRLADPRGDASPNFRGYTYPFVFATRRHDRNPLMGWAWYGALNRSALEADHGACDHNKAYLTEQILSTTIFQIYLALGGDTMIGPAPDRYTRGRASHMTLFLLTKAIESFAAPPSEAEALELAMEDAGLSMSTPLLIEGGPDAWQPGLTHKVVRWGFEAQGMFPDDPATVLNGPGQAPPVDLYVRNQRPLKVQTTAGPLAYGPGAYVPVSLDWGENARWLMDPDAAIVLGNRGSDPAPSITVRAWIGVVSGTPGDPGWDLGKNITWKAALPDRRIRQIDAETVRKVNHLNKVVNELKRSRDSAVLLIEISNPDDRANTDPAAALPAMVADGAAGLSDLPTIPRQLTDLVACDNNLGLMLIR
ncbi:MAG: hypothetical protein AAFV19_16250 [Pseudomonadota bacterium]